MVRAPFERTIFLDVEGVLVTPRSILAVGQREGTYNPGRLGFRFFIDQVALNMVCRTALECDADIAITSTLRRHPQCVHTLMALMTDYYYSLPQTPQLGQRREYAIETTGYLGSREEEIQDFVKSFEVKRFAVVDDRVLSIDNFVHVDPSIGFAVRHYQAVKECLLDADDPERKPKIFPL